MASAMIVAAALGKEDIARGGVGGLEVRQDSMDSGRYWSWAKAMVSDSVHGIDARSAPIAELEGKGGRLDAIRFDDGTRLIRNALFVIPSPDSPTSSPASAWPSTSADSSASTRMARPLRRGCGLRATSRRAVTK